MSMKLLAWKTLYELLYKEPPSYEHPRTFGCLHYAAINPKSRHKFDMRGRWCGFLGDPLSQKSYKLYDLVTHQLFMSRDVDFIEHIFPYSQTQLATDESSFSSKQFTLFPK